MNDNKPKSQEDVDDVTYRSEDYKKLVFQFSTEDLQSLQPLEEATKLVATFLSLGQIAQRAKDNFVGSQVLTKLGVKNSEDTKFNYDISKNRIVVYEPRNWCSNCSVKKAEFKYQDKVFCPTCIEEVKKGMAKPLEEEKKSQKPEKKKSSDALQK